MEKDSFIFTKEHVLSQIRLVTFLSSIHYDSLNTVYSSGLTGIRILISYSFVKNKSLLSVTQEVHENNRVGVVYPFGWVHRDSTVRIRLLLTRVPPPSTKPLPYPETYLPRGLPVI